MYFPILYKSNTNFHKLSFGFILIIVFSFTSSLQSQKNIQGLIELTGLKFKTINTINEDVIGYFSLYKLEEKDYEYAFQIWDENLNSQGIQSFSSKNEMELVDSEASGQYICMLFKDREKFELRIHNYEEDSTISFNLTLHDDLRKRKDYGNYISSVPEVGFILHQYVDYNAHLFKFNGEKELLFEGKENDNDDFDISLLDYDERYLYFTLTKPKSLILLNESDHLIRFAVYDMQENKMIVDSEELEGYGSTCTLFDAYKEGDKFLFSYHDYAQNEYNLHYFKVGDSEPEIIKIRANNFIKDMEKRPKKLTLINVVYQMLNNSGGVYSFFMMPFDKKSLFNNTQVIQGLAYVVLNNKKEIESIKMLETYEDAPEFQFSQTQNDGESIVSVLNLEDKFYVVRYVDGLIIKDEIPIKNPDNENFAVPAKDDFLVLCSYDEDEKHLDIKLHRLPELQR